MSSKIKIWLIAIIISIIVFLVSLSWVLYNKNKVLEIQTKELQEKVDACQLDNANGVIEKELLYRNLEELNTTLDAQTKIIKDLTTQLSGLKYIPVFLKDDTFKEDDALAPYVSPGDSTDSRGF